MGIRVCDERGLYFSQPDQGETPAQAKSLWEWGGGRTEYSSFTDDSLSLCLSFSDSLLRVNFLLPGADLRARGGKVQSVELIWRALIKLGNFWTVTSGSEVWGPWLSFGTNMRARKETETDHIDETEVTQTFTASVLFKLKLSVRCLQLNYAKATRSFLISNTF